MGFDSEAIEKGEGDRPVMEKTMVEWYAEEVYHRVIEVFVVIAPHVPFPLWLVERLLRRDLSSSQSIQPLHEVTPLVGDTFDAALLALEEADLMTWDRSTDTVTLTAINQVDLQAELGTLRTTPQAICRTRAQITDIYYQLLEVLEDYIRTSSEPHDRDLLVLITPHLVHLRKHHLMRYHRTGLVVYGLQILWRLYRHGAVDQTTLGEETHAVMAFWEPRYRTWPRGWVEEGLGIARAMLASDWPDAPQVAQRLLDMAESVLTDDDDDDEIDETRKLLHDYRRQREREPGSYHKAIGRWVDLYRPPTK